MHAVTVNCFESTLILQKVTCAGNEVCEVHQAQCESPPCNLPPPVARCVSRASCPEVMCMMFCEHGFKTDENGCDICACVDPCEVCEMASFLGCKTAKPK